MFEVKNKVARTTLNDNSLALNDVKGGVKSAQS